MTILNIQMPDFKTRRDAFDVLCKPEVPFPEGWAISWEKPERFTCHCCGFPTIMGEVYDMCSLCRWEEDPHEYADENYEGVASDYMLFDSRQHFEENGSMFIQEDDYDDFERATEHHVLEAKRKLIHAFLDFLQYAKGSAQALIAWQEILKLEIAVINSQQGGEIIYAALLQKLKWRDYPVAIEKGSVRTAYGAVTPDFPGCFAAYDFGRDGVIREVKIVMRDYIETCNREHRVIPEPTMIEDHQNKTEFEGWEWVYVRVNHHPQFA